MFSEHGVGDQLTFDKIAAAKRAGKVSGVDIWEMDSFLQAGEAGLMVKLDASKIPNISKVAPDVMARNAYYGLPYRGSSVVLAYNSKMVSDPPKTLQGLFEWIKNHPGKFTYNTPDTGGSGGNFVEAVLKVGIPQSKMKIFQTSYDPSLEKYWDKGWKILKEIGPYTYKKGFYPKGNVGVLQLLAKGTIWVAPVWSDMALSYLAQGLLPPEIKLEQIEPPFNGGASYIGVVADCQHKQVVYKFLGKVK